VGLHIYKQQSSMALAGAKKSPDTARETLIQWNLFIAETRKVWRILFTLETQLMERHAEPMPDYKTAPKMQHSRESGFRGKNAAKQQQRCSR
jgi:hypothetical protein